MRRSWRFEQECNAAWHGADSVIADACRTFGQASNVGCGVQGVGSSLSLHLTVRSSAAAWNCMRACSAGARRRSSAAAAAAAAPSARRSAASFRAAASAASRRRRSARKRVSSPYRLCYVHEGMINGNLGLRIELAQFQGIWALLGAAFYRARLRPLSSLVCGVRRAPVVAESQR